MIPIKILECFGANTQDVSSRSFDGDEPLLSSYCVLSCTRWANQHVINDSRLLWANDYLENTKLVFGEHLVYDPSGKRLSTYDVRWVIP